MGVFRLTLILALVLCLPAAAHCPYNRITYHPTHEAVAQSVRNGHDPHFVSVVVPVYRELATGNIVRFLSAFAEQGAHEKQFELVTIVNNSPEVAAAKDAIFRENQETIQLLRYAGRETDTPPDFFSKLPPWQREAIEKVRSRKLNIRVVDLSTSGIELNMGIIRNKGAQQALEAHQDREANHILAMMDADTLPNPAYVENIGAHFNDPKLNMLTLDADYRVEGGSDPYVFQSTWAFRFNRALGGMGSAARVSVGGGGGPQTITRAANFKKVGGYMEIIGGEDGMLSQDLMGLGNYRTPHDVRIQIGDRYRPDGFDATFRTDKSPFRADRKISVTQYMLVDALGVYYAKHGKISPAEAKRFFDYFGVPFSLNAWNGRFDETGKGRKRNPNDNALFLGHLSHLMEQVPVGEKPIEELRAFYTAKLDPKLMAELDQRLQKAETAHNQAVDTLKSTVKALFESPASVSPAGSRYADPMVDEFLSGNTWIAERVANEKAQGKSADEVIASLEKDFPDWFLPFAGTPLKKDVDTMNVTRLFLREATFNIDKNPTLRKVTRVLEGELPP